MTERGPFIVLLETLRVRTPMYLGSWSITRLRSYLSGYGHALYDMGRDETDPEWSGFQKWVERRYRSETTHGWDSLILFYNQDERDALEEFWKLLDEYLAEYRSGETEAGA